MVMSFFLKIFFGHVVFGLTFNFKQKGMLQYCLSL